ncbi:hypothetical protein CW751_05240 [Brumimicrobium salinarum]|uniref:Uncharacterized protein n=1 Tax=Brumimicrobium salinarum TaxID=2058658 RepID=A0A2I0R521_9FLAO|nr:hypothetical protein [Brumimicrobium salinarum]PKR81460.1 hypothetical protein CW751_05240 [Brumimicrobium salinarum]
MDLDIPKDFNSDADNKPFTACKVCERDLTKGEIPYSIEKAYKRIDEGEDVTLFEVAICMPCAEQQSQKMSKSSRAYLMQMMGGPEFFEKRKELWDSNWRENWKSACLFSNEAVKVNDEYHIVGQFQGGKLLPNMTPFVIGQSYIEAIQENLSFETKEEMDRFGQQFLGPDPTLKALLKDHQFVMV